MNDITTRGNLSRAFLKRLKEGDLSPIIKKIIDDMELDVQVRGNYLNVYIEVVTYSALSHNRFSSINSIFI